MQYSTKYVRILFSLALAALSNQALSAAPSYHIIAHDFVDGVEFIHGGVRPSIANDGSVVFVGSPLPTGSEVFFVGDGSSPPVAVDFSSAGYTSVKTVKLDTIGGILFTAERSDLSVDYKGVYRTNTTGSSFATILEGEKYYMGPPNSPPPQSRLAISDNGILAFSNIEDGDGSLYTLAPGGTAVVMREGSGTYFNNQALDINNAGTVGIQMEYGDPNNGLSRGILIFDTPGDTLSSIETALERTGVGVQPRFALNNLGQVAFVLDQNITITYFDSGGTPNGSQSFTPGVYLATPTAFGTPFSFTQVADTTGQFDSFSEVRLGDDGTLVFQASVEVSPGNFETGLFTGGDPVADLLIRTGVTTNINGEDNFFSIIRLGDLNGQNQLVVQTSDFKTADQIIWRIDFGSSKSNMFVIPVPGNKAVIIDL